MSEQETLSKNEEGQIILVLSGKGGVGKSTFSAKLALSLSSMGYKVGLLDIDLSGPSIPKIFKKDDCCIYQSSRGWVPSYVEGANGLSLMSIGFLLKNKDDPIIFRGPKKTALVKQFIDNVFWGKLDYLVVDTPPGVSDEHLTIREIYSNRKCVNAVVITTPQEISISDVRAEISFCKSVNINIIGLVENMSGFVCPKCATCTNIFSSGAGNDLANECQVRFLGKIPLDPSVTSEIESSDSFVQQCYNSPFKETFREISLKVEEATRPKKN